MPLWNTTCTTRIRKNDSSPYFGGSHVPYFAPNSQVWRSSKGLDPPENLPGFPRFSPAFPGLQKLGQVRAWAVRPLNPAAEKSCFFVKNRGLHFKHRKVPLWNTTCTKKYEKTIQALTLGALTSRILHQIRRFGGQARAWILQKILPVFAGFRRSSPVFRSWAK